VELAKIATAPSGTNQQNSRQMEELRDQLCSAMRIADQLAVPSVPAGNNRVTERYVRNMISLRRRRDNFFGGELFADPAWDMLLELYAATLGQFRVSISNLCAGAAVPATTGLRWIKQLEETGMIQRKADPTDGRRYFMELTDKSVEKMNAYFRTVPVAASLI
jgi:DNA-binding MarR family transcriptional regulator